MRLAIGIRGISYYNNERTVTNAKTINYINCVESFEKNVLNTLKGVFPTIDFFMVTYYNEKMAEIIQHYKPLDCVILPHADLQDQKNTQQVMTEQFKLLINLIRKTPMNYSHILLTRFDLCYMEKLDLTRLNFFTKINFNWKGPSGENDDTFILFPIQFLSRLEEYLSIPNYYYTHGINKYFKDQDNYISELNLYKHMHVSNFLVFERIYNDCVKYRNLHVSTIDSFKDPIFNELYNIYVLEKNVHSKCVEFIRATDQYAFIVSYGEHADIIYDRFIKNSNLSIIINRLKTIKNINKIMIVNELLSETEVMPSFSMISI